MADTTDPTPDAAPEDSADADVQALSYEQARDELVRIVARIESGEAPLEESMKLWERGEALATHCQAKLDQAQTRLDSATEAAEPVTGDPADESSGAGQA
jgi:exodeoxyribonuclease VII small subunit